MTIEKNELWKKAKWSEFSEEGEASWLSQEMQGENTGQNKEGYQERTKLLENWKTMHREKERNEASSRKRFKASRFRKNMPVERMQNETGS